jgi:hypothetical protein
MDSLRAVVVEMVQQEHLELDERKAQSARAYRVAVATGLVSAVAGLALLGAFTWVLGRGLAARQQAAALIEEQRAWLRVALTIIGDAVPTVWPRSCSCRGKRSRWLMRVIRTRTGRRQPA